MKELDRGVRQLRFPGPEFDIQPRHRLRLLPHGTPGFRPTLVSVPRAVQLDFFPHLPGDGGAWPPPQLLADLRGAVATIVMVFAWFTDPALARALVFARAPQKTLIIGDSTPRRSPGLALIQVVADPAIEVVRIEAADALMHCKRVVIDDRICWHGSANATRGARRNYEELWRQEGGGDLFERYREQDEFLRRVGKRLSAA